MSSPERIRFTRIDRVAYFDEDSGNLLSETLCQQIKREITEEDVGYVPTPYQQNVDMNMYPTTMAYTTTASDVRPQMSATPSPRKRNLTNSPPQREATTKRRIKDEGFATEEEERKRQRRERNKLAAARCR